MKHPVRHFWQLKLEQVKNNLENNNFQVSIVQNADEAKEIALERIIPGLDVKTISWGGSMSFIHTGLYDALKDDETYEILDTFDKKLSKQDMVERRRNALLTDLFITGTNALTETGQLVNLDMIGNRVAAMMYGPKNVLLIVGRNKICQDVASAVSRIKDYAAPVNIMRLEKKTPCLKTGVCQDCSSPDRICNYWTILEKSFEKQRIKIILVNEDLGF